MLTSRRAFLAGSAALFTRPLLAAEPRPRVAIARCPDYGAPLEPALRTIFDQLGGLGSLVKGKTVAMKVNLTGSPAYRLGYQRIEDTTYTHPRVIGATVHLLGRAGARRIRILESAWATADPLEEYMLQAGWEPNDILRAAERVEFENTNWLGRGKMYSRFWTPKGGHIFKGFDLNHSFEDCDVFVSLAKMKEHFTTGITLSLKNCFGNTPVTIYGEGAGIDEPSEYPRGGRGMFHRGHRQPSKSAPSENDPATPREDGYRVPRIVADICAARPIHLAIVEGISTMTGGEGPWIRRRLGVARPGVLFAGLDAVATDAVGAALMGFDPMADRGTAPFETCDNTLRLAEELGAGTRDPKRIEVVGTPIREAVFKFRT